ncbi:bifunctional DNA primase/helicase, partial [bacterium M00.F.Ca.ET.221.01.1.1]
FWDAYEYIEMQASGDRRTVLNHSREESRIAINLNEFIQKAGYFGQQVPDIGDLRRLLVESKRHKFISANTAVNSAIRSTQTTSTTVKCWVFQK